MTNLRAKTRQLSWILFLVLVTMLSERSAAGQDTEVQIMVNGPWAYAQDPADPSRVVVIGALTDHHGPVALFPGDDAHANDSARRARSIALVPGKFKLDLHSDCGNSRRSSTNVFLVPVTPDPDVVKKVIDDRNNYQPRIRRYTISLPKPCYYVSHSRSRSRIGPESERAPTTEGEYTTWMELHYLVSRDSSATLSGESDDATLSYNDTLRFLSNGTRAISMVISAPEKGSDKVCDSHSLESFLQLNALFGLKLQAQFPNLEDIGGGFRQGKKYSSKCIGRSSTHPVDSVELAAQTLVKIDKLEADLADPSKSKELNAKETLDGIETSINQLFDGKVPLGIQGELKHVHQRLAEPQSQTQPVKLAVKKSNLATKACGECMLITTKSDVMIMTVGSADCRAGQFSINSVVQ